METASENAAPRCDATVGLNEAAKKTWDVVIAGAGPAGSLLACLLARWGISVLLVDKSTFPREKVCGSCLNGAALSSLRAAGLRNLVTSLGGVPLSSMVMRANGREAVIKLPEGVALSRRAFDVALVRAAVAAGADFLPGAEATLEPDGQSLRIVRLRAGSTMVLARTHVTVAADGVSGSFLKAINGMSPVVAGRAPLGLGAVFDEPAGDYTEGTIWMGCTPYGYLGAVRLEDGRLDVALAVDRGYVQEAGGTLRAIRAIFRECGLSCPTNLRHAPWRGTPPLSRRRLSVAGRGLVVIGDAAGYVEPLTGEGMSWAMQESILAAPLVRDAILAGDSSLVCKWHYEHRRFFRSRCGVCRVVTWMRRRFMLGSLAVTLLAHAPWLAAPWVRSINRASPQIARSLIR